MELYFVNIGRPQKILNLSPVNYIKVFTAVVEKGHKLIDKNTYSILRNI